MGDHPPATKDMECKRINVHWRKNKRKSSLSDLILTLRYIECQSLIDRGARQVFVKMGSAGKLGSSRTEKAADGGQTEARLE